MQRKEGRLARQFLYAVEEKVEQAEAYLPRPKVHHGVARYREG
jgi:hypothetical protein